MSAPFDTPPEWAIQRALAELCVGGQPVCHVVKGFARYIAEHEEPPVDPLLIEAREIVAGWYVQNPPKCRVLSNSPEHIRDGKCDDRGEVRQALSALKRGMELGRGEA